jgi:hypothetical protein
MKAFQRKTSVLTLTAYASLKHAGEPTDYDNIQVESNRIEKIATKHYNADKSVIEYNEFIIKWVKENADEIVYGDTFSEIFI